jgi:hypothetical protein
VTAEEACGWITRGIGRRLTCSKRSVALSNAASGCGSGPRSLSFTMMPGVHSAPGIDTSKVEVPHGYTWSWRPRARDGRRVYRDVLTAATA